MLGALFRRRCVSGATGGTHVVARRFSFTDVDVKETIEELKQIVLQQQRKAAGPQKQNDGEWPSVCLSTLMLEIPPSLKTEVRRQGGLVKTLRAHSDSFIVSPSGLEVGVAGATSNADSLRPPEVQKAPPKTIGQNMKTVLVQPNRKQPGPAPSNDRWSPRLSTDGKMFSCAYGSIDMTSPPLDAAEVEKARKLRYTEGYDMDEDDGHGVPSPHGSTVAVSSMPGQLPTSYYTERGYYTPQEVADMYAPYCPTFPIEIKIFMKHLPAALKDPVMNPKKKPFVKPQDYMRRYPMVFTIVGGKHKLTTVRLADALQHAAKGKADRYLQRFRTDRVAKSRHEERDDEIASVLEKNLKARATKEDEVVAFVRLVDFINSFPKEDIDNLNHDPPERVISVIQKSPHLFQLRGDGGEHEYYDGANEEEGKSPTTENRATDAPKLDADFIGDIDEVPAPDEDNPKAGLPEGISDYFIRLRPSWLAPFCMSNFGLNNSPHPALAKAIIGIVGVAEDERKVTTPLTAAVNNLPYGGMNSRPRSVPRGGSGLIPPAPAPPAKTTTQTVTVTAAPTQTRKWVTLEKIYETLPMNLRKELKAFRGLASFLRLHGRLFHVSRDKLHVIAHNPNQPPPLLVTTREGDDITMKMKGLHSTGGKMPTTRTELMAMDPHNALLDPKNLCEEIHRMLPDHPVSLQRLERRMPPLMRAALPNRPQNMLSRSPLFSVWAPSPGNYMLQKAELGPPPEGYGVRESVGIEEALELIRQFVPPQGIPLISLRNKIPPAARNTVRTIGGIDRFIASYPQYFVLDESVPHRTLVYLAEHFEAGVTGGAQ